MVNNHNEKGFTLIELLVSVAILAVVIVPFMFVFLTSSKVNMKTKEQQSAKYAATNVMEDIRSRSIENVLADANTVEQADGTYVYTTVAESDGKQYTVEATLDPGYEEDLATDEVTDYNAEKFAQLYQMNSAYDAFCEIDTAQDNKKIAELAEVYLNNSGSQEENIYSKINREIIVTIQKQDGKTRVYVKTVYSLSQNVFSATSNQCVYSNGSDDVELRGIFLFFSPLYNGTSDLARETITVINEDKIPCTLYLCQQAIDAVKQNTYRVNVRLTELGRTDNEILVGDELQPITRIRTNIDEDVTKYEGKRSSSVSKRNMNLYYGTQKNSFSEYYRINGKEYATSAMMNLNSLAGLEKSDIVYRVSVKAYAGVGEDRANECSITLETTTQ